MTELVAQTGPDWVVAEMPSGYQIRLNEIQRLVADLQQMGRFGRLLYAVGPDLGEAIRDAFAAMKFETEILQRPALPAVAVHLEGRRRLLLIPSAGAETLQKKSPELTEVFHLLQDVAEDVDRVVLVTNVDPETPPSSRSAALAPDALALLVRMGAAHLTGPTLFNLWKVSLQAMDKAREQVQRLHDGEPGDFEVSASLLRLSELRV
jgi:hypothetical protein